MAESDLGSPSPAELRVRIATAADAWKLAELRFAFRSEFGAPAEAQHAFIERCASWMDRRLASNFLWTCWVVEEGGQILGNVWLHRIEKVPNPVLEPEWHAYITNCYVLANARGRGLGRRLLEEAVESCRTSGVDAVLLWPSERSRSLYLRHGFAVREDVLELWLTPTS